MKVLKNTWGRTGDFGPSALPSGRGGSAREASEGGARATRRPLAELFTVFLPAGAGFRLVGQGDAKSYDSSSSRHEEKTRS